MHVCVQAIPNRLYLGSIFWIRKREITNLERGYKVTLVEIICRKCDHYVYKKYDEPSFDSPGRYWNVWHMWCKVFGDLEKAIETGECDLHNDERFHEHRQLKLETYIPELLQTAEQPQQKVNRMDE
ncbi:MAG: hypothetical protein JSV57_01145 [Candidatus Bathyarchaeota archaeon]|nr:MAG: hypothetical protein JSV57_01145 [Candidatus Bathyarchaeota archaeon]